LLSLAIEGFIVVDHEVGVDKEEEGTLLLLLPSAADAGDTRDSPKLYNI